MKSKQEWTTQRGENHDKHENGKTKKGDSNWSAGRGFQYPNSKYP